KVINPSGNYLNQNACVPLMVELVNAWGQPANTGNAVTFDIDLTGSLSSATLHHSLNCDDEPASNTGWQTNDRTLLFLKPVDYGLSGTISVEDSSSVLNAGSLNVSSVALETNNAGENFKIFPDFFRNDFNIASP